jgi:hypothetical protein
MSQNFVTISIYLIVITQRNVCLKGNAVDKSTFSEGCCSIDSLPVYMSVRTQPCFPPDKCWQPNVPTMSAFAREGYVG